MATNVNVIDWFKLLVRLGGTIKKPIKVPNATTYVCKRNDSGCIHIVPNLTANCVIDLPTPENGLEYVFMYGGVAADAQTFSIRTMSNTNFYLGGLVHIDTDAAADPVVVYPNGSTNSRLNVLVPAGGTEIKLFCDGLNWFVNGQVVGATAPTFAVHS